MEELFMQVFERRDWVEAQMQEQVVSYSESLACAILAAGRRPPPWLFPALDTVPARGNTLKKSYLDLGNLNNEDNLHHVLPQTYQRVEPKTLEFGAGKPGGLHIANCPGENDQLQKCVFESVVKEFNVTHSVNEGPPSTSPVEVPHSVMSSLVEKDILQPVDSSIQGMPHSVTSPLPEEETIGVSETESLTGMTCMASQHLENVSLQSLKPTALEGPDSLLSPLCQKETTDAGDNVSLMEPIAVASPCSENDPLQPNFLGSGSVLSPLPEKDARHTAEMGLIEGPISVALPVLENNSLQPNILNGPDSFSCSLPERIAIHSAETYSVVGLISMSSPQFENDSIRTNLLEGPDSVPTSLTETDARHTTETDSLEGLCPVASFLLEKDSLYSDKANCPEGPNSLISLLSEKEPTHMFETDSLEELHHMTNAQLENTTLHSVEANSPEGPHSMVNLVLEKETTHNLETPYLEESYCPVIRQTEKDSLHREEHTDTPRKNSFSYNRIDENLKILEQQSSECHVLSPPCDESSVQPDYLANTTCEAPKVLATPQENMSGDDCGYFLNPEENMLEDDHGRILHSYLGGTVTVSSLTKSAPSIKKLLHKSNYDSDVYQSNSFSSGTTFNHDDPNSCNAIKASSRVQSSLSKPTLEYDMICAAADTHMVSAAMFTPNKSRQRAAVIDSVNCHQQQSDHAQADFLAQSEAYDVYVRNNMNESVMPERTSTESAEKSLRSHDGTEHQIICFDIAMEKNSNSCKTVSDKQTQAARPCAQHLLHSSRCGEITSMRSDVESTDSHQGRSVADVIQAQGNSSCEMTEMDCQSDDALYNSSSTMSTSSMDCQHDILDNMENRADISGKPQHSVFHLDSSGSHECISLDLEQRSDTNNWKSPVSYKVHSNVNSSSKGSMSSLSDVIHCNSLRMKSLSCGGCSLSGNVATGPQDSSSSCFDILSDADGQYTRKNYYPGADVKYVMVEDQGIQTDYVVAESAVLNPKNHSSTTPTTFPRYASSDQQSQQAYASNCSNIELGEEGILGDPEGHLVSDGDIPLQNSDETVEEHQSCGIPIPANSPTIQERVIEAYRDSTMLVNLSSNLSTKYKMDNKMESLRGKCESLAARFEKLLDSSSLMEVEPKWHYPSYDTKRMGVSGNQEDREIPLTPSFGKYSLEKPTGGARYTSECIGSIPDLACFRIDEDSSTAEENENRDKLYGSLGGNYSRPGLTGRKPLECVTSLHQSKEKSTSLSRKHMDVGRLDLPTTKASSREPDHQAHLIIDQTMKNPKENRAPSIRKEVKVTRSFHDREIKGGILGNQAERHRSEANLDKGWKPSNIVTSMTSFIPLVKQKQQPTAACVKRDVRVKALEVAEAAKRREQKKQNEREMRKAAAELERERLKQEREQKQKLMEQKKKMDADIVTRKRQRADDGRKEKEKKTKCIEESRKQQKQLGERMHTGNSGKDAGQKDPDDAELGKNIIGVVINQLLSDKKIESVPRLVTSGSNNVKAVVTYGKSESSHQVHESLSDDADKSYEMSPYEDSDEEDDGDLEHKEEVRRRQKSFPPWTRKEILDKIILFNQTLDSREIFERKCSFRLSNVLVAPIPQRRLN